MMATSTSAPVLLLLAATLLLHPAISLACSNCSPTTPTWPSPCPGGGCHCRPPHHCNPPHGPPCHCPPHGPPCDCPPHHCRPPHGHGCNCPPCNPPASRTCPIDSLKLNACVDVLGGLIHLVIGRDARATCCPLVQGVADLDAALCLCTAIRARVLSIDIFLPIALNLLVSCGKNPPSGFQCPALYD